MEDLDVFAIRRRNLILLLSKRGAASRVCESTGTAMSYLSTLKNGGRRLGDDLARRIEEAEGLSYGWLDRQAIPDAKLSYIQADTLDDLALLLAAKSAEEIAHLMQLVLHYRDTMAIKGRD